MWAHCHEHDELSGTVCFAIDAEAKALFIPYA